MYMRGRLRLAMDMSRKEYTLGANKWTIFVCRNFKKCGHVLSPTANFYLWCNLPLPLSECTKNLVINTNFDDGVISTIIIYN